MSFLCVSLISVSWLVFLFSYCYLIACLLRLVLFCFYPYDCIDCVHQEVSKEKVGYNEENRSSGQKEKVYSVLYLRLEY